ncbi:sensor domain-containing protein [Streptomyces sanglieri]|uniref:Sensor domain-containing protein n=1 Tax=Streptomyces sanglieri TaxID=193460 RepID=A0ABW2WY07_9ACTN
MRERLWLAWRATRHLLRSAGLALASFLFLPLLAFTVTVTVLVIGAGVLPETVLLLRRLAGAKRREVANWTGRRSPRRTYRSSVTSPCGCVRRSRTPGRTVI